MMKLLKPSAALIIAALAASATAFALDDENAQATLTVTQFRSMNPVANTDFTDASTALVPQPAVTLVNVAGMPTFRAKRAHNLEIKIASADGNETHRPIGVFFRQKQDRLIGRADAEGRINFAWTISAAGTLVIQHKFIQRGDDSRYEFFMLVQRVSDGAIGLIDPDINSEPGE